MPPRSSATRCKAMRSFSPPIHPIPLANRVRALLAARREAITWRRTCRVDTPDAYWSYLNRYPRGPHAADARRRLATLAAAEEPPPSFAPIVYDVPPPPPAEIVYVDRPVLVFSDPVFGFPPPPPVVYPGAAAGLSRLPAAAAAGWTFCAAGPRVRSGPGLGQSASLCGAAARKRHLQQHSQHDHHQQQCQRHQSGCAGAAGVGAGGGGRCCSWRGGRRDRRESRSAPIRGPQGINGWRPGSSGGAAG